MRSRSIFKELVSLARSASRFAFAVNRLAERYGESRLATLSPEYRWLLDAMIRDHLNSIDTALHQQKSLLDEVFAVEPAGAGPPPLDGDQWDAVCGQLFREVQDSQNLLIEPVTTQDSAGRGIDTSLARIHGYLETWAARRLAVDRIVTHQFHARSQEP